MPLIKPQFVPGIIKDESKLAAEGGWTDCDKMRFVGGKPQVVGGTEELATAPDPIGAPFDGGVFDSVTFHTSATATEAVYPGQARGAHAWTDNQGGTYIAWGTGAGLFVLHNSIVYDITPADFTPEGPVDTKLYGAGFYGVGLYGRATRTIWALDNWGEHLLACPRGGKLYEWSINTAVKAIAVVNAPTQVNYFFVSPERIVVLLGTTEFGGSTFNPTLVRWCDQGDNTQWTPAPTNVAGEFPLSFGSKLVAGVATRGLNLLWTDTAIYTMQFTGSLSSVFVIRPAGFGCGLIGPHAKTSSDSAVFWMSRDNFYVFNGQAAQILPCTVLRDVLDNLYPNSEDKSHVGWNTAFGETWFHYADTRDATGEISRYAMVNAQGQWAVGTSDVTAWIRAGIYPFPITFSSDDHKLFYQEVPDAGLGDQLLDAYIESGFIDVGDGDTLYTIKRIVPDFNNQGPTVNISLKTRLWPNQSATTHGPYLATPTTTKLDVRVKARQMAVRLDSAGAAGASFWELGATSFDSQPSGEKR